MRSSSKLGLVILTAIVLGTPCPAQSGKLRPSQHYVDYGDGPPNLHVSRISRNRKLASIGDTLFMLDRRDRIIWKWTSEGQAFTDLPIIDSTGTIYIIGYDLLWAGIDSATGKQKWRSTAVGRALFSQIKRYRQAMYLVVTNMEGYRDSLRDMTIEDEVSLCKGNDVLWKSDIPANSRLRVVGNRVFVVFKQNKRLVRWPINIPNHLRKPIGIVDGRLWKS